MTRFAAKFAIVAAAAFLSAGAAHAQGAYQWNQSQATDPGVAPGQISEPVRAFSAQALYVQQTGKTHADAVAINEPGEIFADHVGAYSL